MSARAQNDGLQTGHVGLNVSDLERAKNFYREVFGFEITGESKEAGREFAFLAYKGGLVLTLWQQSEGRFDKRQPGLHHLSFQVAAIEGVKEAERRLRAMNVPLLYDGIVPHGEGAQSGGIFFEDPDGIRLEIYAPTGVGAHEVPTPGAPSCGFF
ncbi:MAG: VOC family protein [Acidobacteriota bacterium]|nr:VOC family protein [Acidobacteriota bacterium]